MNPDNVLAEFERAKGALQAARNLPEDRLYEDAVSRSYYAVMHAAKAALLVHDAIAESHAAVGRLFGSVLVRPGLIEAEWADVLAESTAAVSRPITALVLLGNQKSRHVLSKRLVRLFSVSENT